MIVVECFGWVFIGIIIFAIGSLLVQFLRRAYSMFKEWLYKRSDKTFIIRYCINPKYSNIDSSDHVGERTDRISFTLNPDNIKEKYVIARNVSDAFGKFCVITMSHNYSASEILVIDCKIFDKKPDQMIPDNVPDRLSE